MASSLRPRSVGAVALTSFAAVFGLLATCKEDCPGECGPSVMITWEPGVLPAAELVEVCVGGDCTTASPYLDTTERGSAVMEGGLSQKGTEAEVYLGLYNGTETVASPSVVAPIDTDCGCRLVRLTVTNDGEHLRVS